MFVLCVLFVSGILACNTLTSSASPTPIPRQAILSNIENEVLARDVNESAWQKATDGESIQQGGGAETKDAARARLDITDGTIVRLGPNSLFELKELTPTFTDPQTRLFLEAGKIWVAVTKSLGKGNFEIETPVGLSGVRGSLMSAEYTSFGQMVATCLEGACYLSDLNGHSVDLKPGEQSEILGDGKSPTPPHLMDTSALDDWATNFPEAVDAVTKIKTPIAVVGNWQATTDLGWLFTFRVTDQGTIADFTIQIPSNINNKCGTTEFERQSLAQLEFPITNNRFEFIFTKGEFTSTNTITGTYILDNPATNCRIDQTWAGSPAAQ